MLPDKATVTLSVDSNKERPSQTAGDLIMMVKVTFQRRLQLARRSPLKSSKRTQGRHERAEAVSLQFHKGPKVSNPGRFGGSQIMSALAAGASVGTQYGGRARMRM